MPNGGSLPVVCVCVAQVNPSFFCFRPRFLPTPCTLVTNHPTQPFTHPPEKLRANKCTKEKRADSTLGTSQAVPNPSTIRALCHLTSEVGRDPVYLTRYGRQQMKRISALFQRSSPAGKPWERTSFSCSVLLWWLSGLSRGRFQVGIRQLPKTPLQWVEVEA